MYSDDDRRYDEQRRLDEQRREEQRRQDDLRRDDDAAYARRQEEDERYLQAFYRQRDEKDRQLARDTQKNHEEYERKKQDYEEWLKKEQEQGRQTAIRLQRGHEDFEAWLEQQSRLSRPSDSGASKSSGSNNIFPPDTHPVVALGILILALAVAYMIFIIPLALIHGALTDLVVRFPRYAMDPSFAGQLADIFARAFNGPWAQELLKTIDTLWKGKDWIAKLLWSGALWLAFFIGLTILTSLFRAHKKLGAAVSLMLVGVSGLYIYVSMHFSG